MGSEGRHASELYAYVGLCALWLLQIAVLTPTGAFPLNDDWLHSRTIFDYVTNGIWMYPAPLAAYNLVPIAYGITLSKVIGFSFTALRATNLTLGLLSSLVFYRLLRLYGTRPSLCLLATLLFWFNPLIFNLSYSFMGDIPALFFLVAAWYCFEKGFADQNALYILYASALLLLGFFTRQVDLLLFAAVAPMVWKLRKHRRIVVAFLTPGAFGVAIWIVLNYLHIIPPAASAHLGGWQRGFWPIYARTAWKYALQLSLYASPLSVAILLKNFRTIQWRVVGTVAVILLAITYLYPIDIFPSSDLISKYGLGVMLPVIQGIPPTWGPAIVYNAAMYLSAILLAFHCYLLYRVWRERKPKLLFTNVFFILYFIAILWIGSFDRYLALLVPFVIAGLAVAATHYNYSRMTVAIGLVLMAAYSMIGTYNYFSWNRARWQAGRDLITAGVPATTIEGGFEWDGWYIYGKSSLSPNDSSKFSAAPWYVQDWFPNHPMIYVLSLSPVPNYDVIRTLPVSGIASNIHHLYVSKRAGTR